MLGSFGAIIASNGGMFGGFLIRPLHVRLRDCTDLLRASAQFS
jgi:hypothetical protein